MADPLAFTLNTLSNATPLLLAALGELLVERTGKVNLGVEGLMALGAAVTALVGAEHGLAAGLLAAALAGVALSMLYALSAIILGADQVVVGLATVFTGLGLSELAGRAAGGSPAPPLPGLIGGLDAFMVAALAGSILAYHLLYRTWLGVELRAIGESEETARARGLRVAPLRVAAVAVEGALAGLAGAYMVAALSYGRWYSGVTGGWGWLAIGLVILGYWHPVGVAVGSLAVGALFAARPLLPGLGVPPALADATPYLAVMAALAAAARLAPRLGVTPPASLWRSD